MSPPTNLISKPAIAAIRPTNGRPYSSQRQSMGQMPRPLDADLVQAHDALVIFEIADGGAQISDQTIVQGIDPAMDRKGLTP